MSPQCVFFQAATGKIFGRTCNEVQMLPVHHCAVRKDIHAGMCRCGWLLWLVVVVGVVGVVVVVVEVRVVKLVKLV